MKTDLVILGAGPVGLFTAFYGAMRDLDVVIVDQLEVAGGQLSALYPEKEIYDVAGFNEIKAKDLVKNLNQQLKRFENKINFLFKEEVLSVSKKESGRFDIKTSNQEIDCGAFIIAGGNGGFSPRKLGIENEETFDIDYFINEPEKYRDKDVVIFGGGDSAVDFSLMIEKIAKSVSIVHRRNEFRAHDHSVNLLKASSVNINTPYTPVSIEKKDEKYKVNITSVQGDKSLEVDKVICNFGFVSKLGSIANFGLDIEKNKIKVDSTQKSSVDGIFAVGDICTYEGKANLIITGFGEAPIAINQAYQYIYPERTLKAIHSSSLIGGY